MLNHCATGVLDVELGTRQQQFSTVGGTILYDPPRLTRQAHQTLSLHLRQASTKGLGLDDLRLHGTVSNLIGERLRQVGVSCDDLAPAVVQVPLGGPRLSNPVLAAGQASERHGTILTSHSGTLSNPRPSRVETVESELGALDFGLLVAILVLGDDHLGRDVLQKVRDRQIGLDLHLSPVTIKQITCW